MTEPTRLAFAETGDGRRLAYAQWGDPDGLPVFLLHGTPGCRLNRPIENSKLASTGARVITYDRPGYGQSDRHEGRRVSDCVADVVAIADSLGIGRFAVTGGSGGGPHCLAVAAGLPDRVIRARCVVGLAPWGAEGLDWYLDMDPENVKEFGWALAGQDVLVPELEQEAAAILERVAKDPSTILGAFEVSEADRSVLADPLVHQLFRESTPESFANGVWGWVDDDLAFTEPWGFDLGSITVPTEIHYGETDVLVPAGHGRWLASHVPGAEVHVKTDKGHMAKQDEILAELAQLVRSAGKDL